MPSRSHIRAILSRKAFSIRWGRYRREPAWPWATVGISSQYNRTKIPREVKVDSSVPLITEASCQ